MRTGLCHQSSAVWTRLAGIGFPATKQRQNTLINITNSKTEVRRSLSELIQPRHDVLHQALVRHKPPSLTHRQRNDADPLRRTRLLGVFLRDRRHARSFHATHFPCFRGHPSYG